MYSLVSASLLGFDLVRLPAGDQAAAVLLWALGLGQTDVLALADLTVDGPARDEAWAAVRRLPQCQPSVLQALALTRARAQRGPIDEAAAGNALELLSGATFGTLDDLLRLVRGDVLGELGGENSLLLTVVADAAAAAYAWDRLSPSDRRALTMPWLVAVRRLGARRASLGPGGPAVDALIARARAAGPRARPALRSAAEQMRRGSTGWAEAMHDATWAAHLSGRVRAAAAAQLSAVLALRFAGVAPAEAAAGTWNLVSGAVQALVVADLLPGDALDALLTGCRAALA